VSLDNELPEVDPEGNVLLVHHCGPGFDLNVKVWCHGGTPPTDVTRFVDRVADMVIPIIEEQQSFAEAQGFPEDDGQCGLDGAGEPV